MYIEQIYTACLSEASYYIESDGEAAIIDPVRDVEQYIQLAQDRHATIKYIFETHFHADFVSGHLELSKKTGATIVFGPDNKASFPVLTIQDGGEIPLGKIKIKVLHTPGHTYESVCYLVINEKGKAEALFTGDTLFVGDVGRPDLSQKGNEDSVTSMAGLLFDSLRKKILPLEDDVIVYPGHGAGSNCGKQIGMERVSTIGTEKQNNYALQAKNKDEFILLVTSGLNEPPVYFPVNAELNKKGYTLLSDILPQALTPLSVNEVEALKDQAHVVVLDTRNEREFTDGFIPGALFIGLDGRFAEWAGQLIPFDAKIVIVADEGKEKEAAVRLARVGFDNIEGYVDGGFRAWQQAQKPVDIIVNMDAEEVYMDYRFDKDLIIIDVRRPAEYNAEHVKNAVNIPLETLTDPAASLSDVEDNFNMYLHCAGGYRSVIAASIFKREGIHNLHNIIGGFNALKTTDIPLEKNKAALN